MIKLNNTIKNYFYSFKLFLIIYLFKSMPDSYFWWISYTYNNGL